MNNKVLVIGRPWIEDNPSNGCSRLCIELFESDKHVYTVWYEVFKEYKSFLTTERIDGIIVNLMLYAMEHGYDLKSEVPISEALHYKLTNYLIPSISSHIAPYMPIEIDAPFDGTILPSANAVGASLSGGVDSFYTLLKNIGCQEKSFNITHVTFFNAGASGAHGGDWARERYRRRIEWIQEVALQYNLRMVCVDTNINEFLQQDHEPTNTFRTLAIPLILEKLFSKYYFASSYQFENFRFAYMDTAYYDLLNLPCISTENLTFLLDGAEASRCNKLKFIAQERTVQEKLNVCTAEVHNCGKCDKCRRTILGLYAVGALDKFNNAFDIEYFYKNKHTYFRVMCALRRWRECTVRHEWNEIYQILKKEVTIFDELGGVVVLAYRIARRKIFRTVFGKKLYSRFGGR